MSEIVVDSLENVYLVSKYSTAFYVKVQFKTNCIWSPAKVKMTHLCPWSTCQEFDSSITEFFHLVYLKRSLEVTEIIPWLFADWLCSWCFLWDEEHADSSRETYISSLVAYYFIPSEHLPEDQCTSEETKQPWGGFKCLFFQISWHFDVFSPFFLHNTVSCKLETWGSNYVQYFLRKTWEAKQ